MCGTYWDQLVIMSTYWFYVATLRSSDFLVAIDTSIGGGLDTKLHYILHFSTRKKKKMTWLWQQLPIFLASCHTNFHQHFSTSNFQNIIAFIIKFRAVPCCMRYTMKGGGALLSPLPRLTHSTLTRVSFFFKYVTSWQNYSYF